MIIRIVLYQLLFLVLSYNGYSQTNSDTSKTAGDGKEIAKQLQNPVANLISIPFQDNFEFKTGPRNGFKYTLNFQPVIPFSLGKRWNLITRTIVPVISQMQVLPTSEGNSTETELSDILFSTFNARGDINSTYCQSFISYVNKAHTTFKISSESSHDIENKRWTTSLVPAISQLTKLG